MPLYAILALVFTILFMMTLALLMRFGKMRHPAVRRMKELHEGPSRGEKRRKPKALQKRKEQLYGSVAKTLSGIGRFIKQDPQRLTKLQLSLGQAGYNRENSVNVFIGIKVFSAAVFFLLFLYVGFYANRSFVIILLSSFVVSIVGYYFPNLVLDSKIRKRQEQIARSLADAIDLLVISVEAGLGLNAALLRVGNDLLVRCRAIAEEFGRVNQDLRTGVSREKALRNLSDRNRVEDLKIFVGALVLADRLGTSIADTLRSQADSLRTRIRQKAEEQAAKAGIKMLFPLVFFILPALVIILMGPALISVVRTFRH